MSGESWLAIKDSSTHQSWMSRPGIQCFFIFLIDLFCTSFYLSFFFLIWGFAGGQGPGGDWGCSVRGRTTYIFNL